MNTLIKTIATGVMVSFLTTNTFALNGKHTTPEKEIQKHLAFPNVLVPVSKTESTKVEVLFTTQEDGQVNFVIAKTYNEQLKKEIEKNFAKLVLKSIKPNVCYGVTLNLKTV